MNNNNPGILIYYMHVHFDLGIFVFKIHVCMKEFRIFVD